MKERWPVAFPEAIGRSEAFLEFQERLSRVAPIDRPVLIVGERGTGKELAARRLHYLSRRWSGPLIPLNCAALSPSLIETELFGHEKGAFTGAGFRRIGRFEAAEGGTLFLDEIGAIPLEAQEKILRVVEYGTFERVGSSVATEVDVRIVGATNADLRRRSREGRFKKDLLDRLSFEVLKLPPLRERREDIVLLAEYFAGRMAVELSRKEIPRFAPSALDALLAYGWPGNIRELKNVVERAVYRARTGLISEIEFDPFGSESADSFNEPGKSENPAGSISGKEPIARLPLKAAVRNLEIGLLKEALENAKFNQKKAARRLGLSYDQLRGMLRKYKKEFNA